MNFLCFVKENNNMDHLAIMRKDWGLLPKILNGQKKIESRWGVNRCAPWGKVKVGDMIYFKNSGEPVTVVTEVSKVLEFENLDKTKVREIFEKYGGDGGISVGNFGNMIKWAERKKYCTLIYLENSKKIKPFKINKKGFGASAAWITANKIGSIKTTL